MKKALESPCVATLLHVQSLRCVSREINPNANHKSTTKAVRSYSSTAAAFQFTL